jgi:hypothetical protein
MKLMAIFVCRSKHLQAYVSNHGLIKILVIHALEQKNATWLEFTTLVGTQGSVEKKSSDIEKLIEREEAEMEGANLET